MTQKKVTLYNSEDVHTCESCDNVIAPPPGLSIIFQGCKAYCVGGLNTVMGYSTYCSTVRKAIGYNIKCPKYKLKSTPPPAHKTHKEIFRFFRWFIGRNNG
jgi:hypothetical protein